MDSITARGLLERALAHTTKPALSTQDIDLLLSQAVDDLGTYSVGSLNAAAALGWTWKAGMTAEQFDLAGGGGKSLELSQLHAHCVAMADKYRNGALSVDGRGGRSGRVGMSSIGLVGALNVES